MVDSAAEARLRAEARARTAAMKADADPLAALQASVAASKAQVQTKNVEIPTIALEQAVNTGDKAAIIDAAKAVAKAQGGSATTQASNAITAVQEASPKPTLSEANIARGDTIKWVGGVNGSWQIIKGTNVATPTKIVTGDKTVVSVTYEGTGKNRIKITKYSDGTQTREPAPEDGGGKKETRREVLGAGASRVIRVYYDDGSFQDFASPETTDGGGNKLDTDTSDLIKSLQAQIANLTTGNAATAAATKAAEKLAERQSAFDVLRAEMDALGLAALVEPLRGLIQKDVSPSEFAVELRQSEAYKNRFIANEGRLKKGLRVLTPGEYLRVEDAYRQTLRTYGLKQFDNDQ